MVQQAGSIEFAPHHAVTATAAKQRLHVPATGRRPKPLAAEDSDPAQPESCPAERVLAGKSVLPPIYRRTQPADSLAPANSDGAGSLADFMDHSGSLNA